MKIVLLNIIQVISTGFWDSPIIYGGVPGFPGVPGPGFRGNSRGEWEPGIVPETYTPHIPFPPNPSGGFLIASRDRGLFRGAGLVRVCWWVPG